MLNNVFKLLKVHSHSSAHRSVVVKKFEIILSLMVIVYVKNFQVRFSNSLGNQEKRT